MQHLVDGVRRAVGAEAWYSALALSLALPDVCSYVERPSRKSRARYVRWCDSYLTPKYGTSGPRADHRGLTFLNGADCYALRCAYLHQGDGDITAQEARQVVHDFIFLAPLPGSFVHCNLIAEDGRHVLQLQVDRFALDVCDAADEWWVRVKDDPEIAERSQASLRVRDPADWSRGF